MDNIGIVNNIMRIQGPMLFDLSECVRPGLLKTASERAHSERSKSIGPGKYGTPQEKKKFGRWPGSEIGCGTSVGKKLY